MNFTRDQTSPVTVHKVEPGSITVGETVVSGNVIIFRDEIQPQDTLGDVSALAEGDLQSLLDRQPEVVILGTGWSAARPPHELVFAMARRGVGFEAMDTPAACRTFNILISEGRDAAAVLIVADGPRVRKQGGQESGGQ